MLGLVALQLIKPPAPSRARIQDGYLSSRSFRMFEGSSKEMGIGFVLRPTSFHRDRAANLSRQVDTVLVSGRNTLARIFSRSADTLSTSGSGCGTTSSTFSLSITLFNAAT